MAGQITSLRARLRFGEPATITGSERRANVFPAVVGGPATPAVGAMLTYPLLDRSVATSSSGKSQCRSPRLPRGNQNEGQHQFVRPKALFSIVCPTGKCHLARTDFMPDSSYKSLVSAGRHGSGHAPNFSRVSSVSACLWTIRIVRNGWPLRTVAKCGKDGDMYSYASVCFPRHPRMPKAIQHRTANSWHTYILKYRAEIG